MCIDIKSTISPRHGIGDAFLFMIYFVSPLYDEYFKLNHCISNNMLFRFNTVFIQFQTELSPRHWSL